MRENSNNTSQNEFPSWFDTTLYSTIYNVGDNKQWLLDNVQGLTLDSNGLLLAPTSVLGAKYGKTNDGRYFMSFPVNGKRYAFYTSDNTNNQIIDKYYNLYHNTPVTQQMTTSNIAIPNINNTVESQLNSSIGSVNLGQLLESELLRINENNKRRAATNWNATDLFKVPLNGVADVMGIGFDKGIDALSNVSMMINPNFLNLSDEQKEEVRLKAKEYIGKGMMALSPSQWLGGIKSGIQGNGWKWAWDNEGLFGHDNRFGNLLFDMAALGGAKGAYKGSNYYKGRQISKAINEGVRNTNLNGEYVGEGRGYITNVSDVLLQPWLSRPAYERVNLTKYSVDPTNVKDRVILQSYWNERYPNSNATFFKTPIKTHIGFDTTPILLIGEMPLSSLGLNISKVMLRRMNKFWNPEQRYVFGSGVMSNSGIDGFMNLIRQNKTKLYLPLKNSNVAGSYATGESYLVPNPWRPKPYQYSLIHEGLSHMTDDVVKQMKNSKGEKLLGDKYKDSSGNIHAEGTYGKVTWPEDLYDTELLEKLIREDSRKPIEGRAVNWEMISDLYRLLAKEKGITLEEATKLPDSEFSTFVENKLSSPEILSEFMEKFDNQYLQDYAKVLRAGNSKQQGAYTNRIIKMILKAPSYLLPVMGGYTLYNNIFNNKQMYKQGGTIHIKKKNKGKFTDYCGGKVTDECILRGKHSSNPAVRKRATFALNARKWKHKSGGAFIDGVNVLDSNPSLYKHIKSKIRMHLEGGKSVNWSLLAQTGVNALSSIISANIQNSALKQLIKANNALMKADEKRLRQQAQLAAYNLVNNWATQLLQLFNSGQGGENVSGIVVDLLRNKLANLYVANNLDNSTLELKNRELQQLMSDNTANAIAGATLSLGEFGINALAKYLQPKSDFNSSAFKSQVSNLSNLYSFNTNSNNGTNVGFTNYMKQLLNAPTWTTGVLNFNLGK